MGLVVQAVLFTAAASARDKNSGPPASRCSHSPHAASVLQMYDLQRALGRVRKYRGKMGRKGPRGNKERLSIFASPSARSAAACTTSTSRYISTSSSSALRGLAEDVPFPLVFRRIAPLASRRLQRLKRWE
ncbi:hypothetical protein B0H11DRAFT_1907543 [Mycena galericulata]|nr:hypothetical protein B0H11DRAFT_1907543 [Mycena galericulata]